MTSLTRNFWRTGGSGSEQPSACEDLYITPQVSRWHVPCTNLHGTGLLPVWSEEITCWIFCAIHSFIAWSTKSFQNLQDFSLFAILTLFLVDALSFKIGYLAVNNILSWSVSWSSIEVNWLVLWWTGGLQLMELLEASTPRHWGWFEKVGHSPWPF